MRTTTTIGVIAGAVLGGAIGQQVLHSEMVICEQLSVTKGLVVTGEGRDVVSMAEGSILWFESGRREKALYTLTVRDDTLQLLYIEGDGATQVSENWKPAK
jgi:hypothetical protein